MKFNNEVTLQFPLPADWDADELPAVYYSQDDNKSDFFLTGMTADVHGSPGSYKGEIPITHFSAWGLARNCHAGTIKYFFEDFEKADCDLTEMTLEVRDKWDSKFRVDPYDYNGDPEEFSLGDVPLQSFLDIYFYKHSSFTLGEDITDAYLESLRQLMLVDGKRIAVGFNTVWRDKNGDGIYEGFAHSAALEIVDGELKLRQSVSVNEQVIQKVLMATGGDNVVYYPKHGELTGELFNIYRQARSGVLLEEAICGSVNCLFSAPVDERPYPYTSVQFYVSNYASGENPCEPDQSEFTTCQFNLKVSSLMETTVYNNGQTSGGQVNGTVFGGTYTGTMNGNIFTGIRDDAPANATLNTTLTAELDDHREKIMLLHVYYHFAGNFTSERELIMTNIPFDAGEGTFIIEGVTTCDHIDLFTTTTTYSDRVTTMDSYECIYGDDEIEVGLW